MPRKAIPIVPHLPYHIGARNINRERFPIEIREVWAIMSDYLYLLANGFEIRIHSFVLMPNHFHLIITPTKENLGDALLYFMRETSKEISRQAGRINQVYGSRNYKTFIGSYHYFMNTYKYVYRNPVRAGLCEKVEDYPFSTLYGLHGRNHLVIPLEEDALLFGDYDRSMEWLNRPSTPEAEEHMSLALRRRVFRFKADAKTRNQPPWETELI